MKKSISALIATFILLIAFSTNVKAQAQSDDLGIGFMAGQPTGLSLKYWTSGNNAFDLGLAWSFAGPYDGITIQGDYLWHNFNVFNDVETGSLPFYYGIGGRLVMAENEANLGARIPLGLNYLFEDSPIGLFVEVAPVFNIIPDTDFDVSGGIGVRFYL